MRNKSGHVYIALAIVFLGLTIITELYVFVYSSLWLYHGLNFFLRLLAAIVFPLLFGACLAKAVFGGKKPKQPAQTPSLDWSIQADKELDANLLAEYEEKLPSLRKDISQARSQIARFDKKRNIIHSMFGSQELPAAYAAGLADLRTMFYGRSGIAGLIWICQSFDETEYQQFRRGELELKDGEAIQRKQEIFDSMLRMADHITDQNEEIILSLDELLGILNMQNNNSDVHDMVALEKWNEKVQKEKEAILMDQKANAVVLERMSLHNSEMR